MRGSLLLVLIPCYGRAEALSFEDNQKGGKKEDAFHFISYLPINGQLYELDGLKAGPINLGPCTTDDWLEKVAPVIEERMMKYQQGSTEIRFNLMAIVKDRVTVTQEDVARVEAKLALVDKKMEALESVCPPPLFQFPHLTIPKTNDFLGQPGPDGD